MCGIHNIKNQSRCSMLLSDHMLVMSRSHAVVSFKNAKFFLQDLNSSNGTFINHLSLEPMREEQIFSDDILQFGSKVGNFEAVKVKISLICPKGVLYRTRESYESEVGKITENDIIELNKAIDQGEGYIALKKKILALEAIIQDFKGLHAKIVGKNEKIKNIEQTFLGLKNVVLSNALEKIDQKELVASVRRILVGIVQEFDKSLDQKTQNDFLQRMISIIKDSLTDSECTDFSKMANNIFLRPEIAVDAEDVEADSDQAALSEDDLEIRRINFLAPGSRSILKRPNSPRTPTKLIRINAVPDVREIENCLLEDEEEEEGPEEFDDEMFQIVRKTVIDDEDESDDESDRGLQRNTELNTRISAGQPDFATAAALASAVRKRNWKRESDEAKVKPLML